MFAVCSAAAAFEEPRTTRIPGEHSHDDSKRHRRRVENARLRDHEKNALKHGAREPFFGVKVEHLKKIQKRIKKDYQLALDLYDTGISDAMYLAGLIADDEKMTKEGPRALGEGGILVHAQRIHGSLGRGRQPAWT